MRRDKRINSTEKETNTKKMLYIFWSILVISIIGFIMTLFIYESKVQNNTRLAKIDTKIVDDYKENTEETSISFGKTVNEVSSGEETKNEINNTNVTKYAINTSSIENEVTTSKVQKTNTNVKTESSTKKTNTTTVKNNVVETKVKEITFKKPVEGEVIREFAKEKLVYSNTLEEWITHNGIDLKADKTTIVKSVADGIIKSIKNDPRYGLTVVIEHDNGFMSIYSNLLTAEFIVEGEKIKQGQTIGTIGSTASFEIKDEPHLHLELMKDGEYIDPELYIK